MSTILTFDLMRDANGLQRQIYTTKYCSISLSSFVFFPVLFSYFFQQKKITIFIVFSGIECVYSKFTYINVCGIFTYTYK